MPAILPKATVAADDRKADRQDAAEAGGGDRPAGRRFPSGDHGTKRAATAAPKENPRAALLRELDRWCACQRFVYQFGLMAKPPEKARNTGRGGRGGRPPRMWRATAPKPHRLGLVAVKHQQALAERAAATEQRGKAFTALAHVVFRRYGAADDKPASATAAPPAG